MVKRMVLPQPPKDYNQDAERIRNREIELNAKAVSEKLDELESRLKAGSL
jgi:hypothetical protein